MRETDGRTLGAVVLAGGLGTRMRSELPKHLHPLLGRRMVDWVLRSAGELGAEPLVVVASPSSASQFDGVEVAVQEEPRGTGDAVRSARSALEGRADDVLVLSGDTPLLTSRLLRDLVETHRREDAWATVLSFEPDDPGQYGRVLRNERGDLVRIVEARDATPEELGVREVNASIYVFRSERLWPTLERLTPHNAQGELYLTDIIVKAAAAIGVDSVSVSPEEMSGVNDRNQLVEAETILGLRIIHPWMKHATFRDPASVVIEASVTVEQDAEIEGNVILRGRTRVRRGARISQGCILTDTDVGEGAVLLPYTVATEAAIGPGAKVGPFAHLRPGTDLGPDVHVGNYVETKKARLGRGSKANHLTYLGDTIIGERVNVGAGTITCNYNGFEKRQTIIEDGAFIGSDTQLVAPVRVGRRAVVAAGTTVTEDIRDGALAITRPPLKQIDGYADKIAARYAKKSDPRRG